MSAFTMPSGPFWYPDARFGIYTTGSLAVGDADLDGFVDIGFAVPDDPVTSIGEVLWLLGGDR